MVGEVQKEGWAEEGNYQMGKLESVLRPKVRAQRKLRLRAGK